MPCPPEKHLYSIKEIVEQIIMAKGIHEGLYDFAIEFAMAVGNVGPSEGIALPGAILGVAKVGIIKVGAEGPHTVDASIVNPGKPKRARPAKAHKP
jgi:hypothetical protein